MAKYNALMGSPCDLFFWPRTRAKVDLVVKAESGMRAFEIKWNPRRPASASFQSAYGAPVISQSAKTNLLSSISLLKGLNPAV
jgi:hypothetical protein